MKRILVEGIAALTLFAAGPALSADLPVAMPTKAPAMVPSMFNWTGFYIGGHAGYGWGNTSYTQFNTAGTQDATGNYNSKGWLGGGQIGANWMFVPNWVVGVEADISAADIAATTFGCSLTGCAASSTKGDEFGTVRARLGYTWNNVMLYGTGGWAWSHSSTDRTIMCVGGGCPLVSAASALVGQAATASGSQGGWAAGTGLEWGFLPSWTAKIEYMHLEFDGVGRDFTYSSPVASRHISTDNGTDIVRVGVNYLFNWRPAPIIAKY